MPTLETTIDELSQLHHISVRAMNVCHIGEIMTLGQLLDMEKSQLLKLRNCGVRTAHELDQIRRTYSHLNVSNAKAGEIEELKEIQLKLSLLSPYGKLKLQSWIDWRFSLLSTRAKNNFACLSDCDSLISTICSNEPFDPLSNKNCGEKTNYEINTFLDEVKSRFKSFAHHIDVHSQTPEIDTEEAKAAKLKQDYPILSPGSCKAIVNFSEENHGKIPYLYIAQTYINSMSDPQLQIYRDYYGFNPTIHRQSFLEIAEYYNISRERVRQIVNTAIPLPEKLKKDIKQYLDPLIGNVVSFESSIWTKIQEENMLEGSPLRTALLVSAIYDSHTILKIHVNDMEYLVRKSLIKNVTVRNVLTDICRIIELRRTSSEQIDILKHIKSDPKRQYHPEVSQLCVIYSNYIRQKYSVEIEDDRIIFLLPNALDISKALENILDQNGTPMSLEQMLYSFNRLYPANALRSKRNLRPYIARNKNIKPKGKTGIYVLTKWKGHFTGTLTDYLEHILDSFDDPIPLDNLVEFALEEFPNSNKKSIYSLILLNRESRFTIYEKEYIGLSDKPNNTINLKKRNLVKRYSFECRFNDLKKFVSITNRFPAINGSNEEKSLARWIINVLKSNIDVTEKQIESLRDFLNENKALPQNLTEYKFKQMCNQIKIIVADTSELPASKEHRREHIWLKKNLAKHTTYKDNKKIFFEDLLLYLRDLGFYLK